MARSLPLLPSETAKGSYPMNIDISFLAGFFLVGTDLLARAAVQGVEQALVATAIEHGSAVVMHVSKWARASRKLCFHRYSQMKPKFNRARIVDSTTKVVVLIVIFCAQLSFSTPVRAEMRMAGALEAVVPISRATEHTLTLVSFSPLVDEGNTVGAVLVYDDPTTTRPEDYFELYDSTGDLVTIGWFDRFGIRRMTVDRGFLDGTDNLAGIFVSLVGGDSL
jgi:hypothetical protein